MAEIWELICHHTYRGIPGVVADVSPLGASHGQAKGLANGDFLADGATPGSGAVQLYKQDGRIHIPAEADAWHSLGGIKGEVTVRRSAALHAFRSTATRFSSTSAPICSMAGSVAIRFNMRR